MKTNVRLKNILYRKRQRAGSSIQWRTSVITQSAVCRVHLSMHRSTL